MRQNGVQFRVYALKYLAGVTSVSQSLVYVYLNIVLFDPSQILDPEMFEHLQQNGDLTHFYFCYRWFLLDFKRGTC